MTDSGLTVTATRLGEFDVLAVGGELDLIAAPVLQEAVGRALADGHPSLVLDLSGVRFLDSAGLRVLIHAHRAVDEQRGDLRIVCSTARVREVFRVANLDQLFVVYGSVAEAIGAE